MKLVTVSEMRAVEQAADASGLSYAQMLQHAGTNLAQVIDRTFNYGQPEPAVLALVGKGNNGGDALVALTWLSTHGWYPVVYLVDRAGEKDVLLDAYLDTGGGLIRGEADLNFEYLAAALAECDVLVDGLLGTGARLPLLGRYAQVLAATQELLADLDDLPDVVAVDCPSGVDCDLGLIAPETLNTDLTVTMAAAKPGLYTFPAAALTGEIELVSIGDLSGLQAWKNLRSEVIDADWVGSKLPERSPAAHKGSFGRVMVAAGSLPYSGAAWLAGQAAFRSGAGWVTMAVIPAVHRVLAGSYPEATWLLLPGEDGAIAAEAAAVLRSQLGRVTCLLLGPGLDQKTPTAAFVDQLVQPDLPALVVDADGLKLLAMLPDWSAKLPADAVLTPHPGEMALLTGLATSEIQADRLSIARRYAAQWGQVVVLKGAFTIVAAPDGHAVLIPAATPALARAGTGDVLAGVIAGLRAQGLPAFDAAACSAWIHGMAGIHAHQDLGSSAAVLAGDVLDALIDVLAELEF